MRNSFFIALIFSVIAACSGNEDTVEEAVTELSYPETKTVQQTDQFHGAPVEDPYRWLEKDVRESSAVADWVEAQNAVTFAYLDELPMRAAIKDRMTSLWNYEKFTVPREAGGKYFFRRNDGLQNQFVLYVQDGLNGEPRVLIDPNGWSADGATALAAYAPSPDGDHVLHSIQDGGSDWRTLKVIETATAKVLPDTVEWVKFSGLAWAHDGSGFYYARYPEPEEGAEYQNLNFNHAVYFHRLGEEQSENKLVYARPEHPGHGFVVDVTDDGRWLVITVWKGTDELYEIVVQDLSEPDAKPELLIGGFEADYGLAGNVGHELIFRTDAGAPRGRIVAVDVKNPARERWRELVPETAGTLTQTSQVGERLVAHYLEDAKSAVKLFALDGTPAGEVALPGIGSAEGFERKAGSPETFFSFSSFNEPSTIYRLETSTAKTEVFRKPDVPFDPDDFVVKQVFYASKDGTRVPMFIAHRADLDRGAPAPTILYGYGGFNIPLTPDFSVTRLTWMEMGGIFAMPNLRGGGEYGKAWHNAGRLLNKQNVFDDFVAAAEHLIEEGYTSPGKLAVQGRSNGGLLVGATVNQRPDLFAAALPAVGVMDMLRFAEFTAGRFWVDDYGDPADEEHFKNLLAYSPYHNIRDGVEYPAVMVTTADTDDRVVPAHSFKYIARLQAADAGDKPHLIRIETRAGHGPGKPTDKIIEEYSDQWSFAAAHTGLNLAKEFGS